MFATLFLAKTKNGHVHCGCMCLSMLFGECCRKHTEKLFTKTRIRIVQLYVCGHTILIYNDNFTNNGHYNKLCLDEQ